MANIQKIFFYTGTALVDPDAEHGCPFHPDHKEVDKNGQCTAICNRPLVPAFRCPNPDHSDSYTSEKKEKCSENCGQGMKPIYMCSKHNDEQKLNFIKFNDGPCGEVCGRAAVEKDVGPTTMSEKKAFFDNFYNFFTKKQFLKWGCPDHFDQEQFDEEPKNWTCNKTCTNKLTKTNKFSCEIHKVPIAWQAPCNAYCNQTMDKPTGRYYCTRHPQVQVNKKGSKCKQACGCLPFYPLKNALGYRRNVSVFMNYVGKYVDQGERWGFCVNTACDPKDNKNSVDKKRPSLASGERKFKYYMKKEAWTKDTQVDAFLTDCKTAQVTDAGKIENLNCIKMETTAPVTDADKAKNLGCEEKYSLGGKDIQNCSSRCLTPDLSTLRIWLSKFVKKQAVFAVCDCNSFHNSAFLFGLLALSRHVKSIWKIDELNLRRTPNKGNEFNRANDLITEPVLILNFDRHTDYGGDKEVVASDQWGGALLKSFRCGAYMAIGIPKYGAIDLHIRRSRKPEKDSEKQKDLYDYENISGANLDKLLENLKDLNKPVDKKASAESEQSNKQDENSSKESAPLPPPSFNKKKPECKNEDDKFDNKKRWKEVFEEIEKFLNHDQNDKKKAKSLKYYYITIDRDCMLHNHNQWGDNLLGKKKGESSFFIDEKHIHKAIEGIRESLGEDAVLTGMDITGLPESQYIPGTDRQLISILGKESLKSYELEVVRKNDKNCVFSKCKKKRKPIEKCPDLECKNKHSQHPDCGHKICPYKNCPSKNCPEPECKECRTEITTNLRKEIDFWYKKFDGWISEQEKKKVKV